MKNLNKANEKRKEIALNKIYNFSKYGCKSFKQLIDKNVFVKSEVSEESKIKYNRVKYNRMNWNEQQEYEAKMKELKKVYYLYYDERVMTECSKFVFDYYNEQNVVCVDCDKKLNEEEKNDTSNGFNCCKGCLELTEEIEYLFKMK